MRDGEELRLEVGKELGEAASVHRVVCDGVDGALARCRSVIVWKRRVDGDAVLRMSS